MFTFVLRTASQFAELVKNTNDDNTTHLPLIFYLAEVVYVFVLLCRKE